MKDSNMQMISGLPLLAHLPDIETRAVLKKLPQAHAALAELKAVAESMPNERILVGTLSLQEAKDSSEIENIITTHDEIYRSDFARKHFVSLAAKEVHYYANALREGVLEVKKSKMLTLNNIIDIQKSLMQNEAGLRKLPGTALKNQQTGEIIYTPPQHPNDVLALMDDLEKFINTRENCAFDPLVKLALIHHQFESIHPFYDGNGRTGRIINILYLILEGLQESPVLYLSRYINRHKSDYYRLLQSVREDQNWEPWLLYMLDAIEQTARQTTVLIKEIKQLMQNTKHQLRSELPNIYSQELINHLFCHLYTKIEFVAEELHVHRNTAAKYMNELVRIGLFEKHKLSRDNYYLNKTLFNLLYGAGERMLQAIELERNKKTK